MTEKNLSHLLATTKPRREQTEGIKLPRKPKILTLDIETSPNVAYTWGLWDQNISLSQIISSTRILSFAAKWHDSSKVMFFSEHHNGRAEMIRAAWDLLDEADILVTYNGKSFDNKHHQREFFLMGLTPPSPWKDVDLLLAVRSQFKFPSNKLDYVSQQIGIGSKVKHEGQELWNKVLAGHDKAWERMRKYNIQDVRLTESLYDYLGPWIKNHPNMGLYLGARCCASCGGTNLIADGFGHTTTTVYTRLQCGTCGSWNRSNVSHGKLEIKPLR